MKLLNHQFVVKSEIQNMNYNYIHTCTCMYMYMYMYEVLVHVCGTLPPTIRIVFHLRETVLISSSPWLTNRSDVMQTATMLSQLGG